MEVCDSLGACSIGASSIVPVAPGEARTVEALLEDARAFVRRCEFMALRRLAASSLVTYTVSDFFNNIYWCCWRMTRRRCGDFASTYC